MNSRLFVIVCHATILRGPPTPTLRRLNLSSGANDSSGRRLECVANAARQILDSRRLARVMPWREGGGVQNLLASAA